MTREDFYVDNTEVLEALAEATGRRTRAEVIQDAISVYRLLVNKAKAGEKMYLGSDRDSATECIVTTLEPIRALADVYKKCC